MIKMVKGRFIETMIENQRVLGATSGTLTVDLPNANYLQGLLLRVQNVNGATSNIGETIQGDITKIEVIGDGIPLFSASGRMCRKIEHYDIGDEPATNETQEPSAVQWAVFPIKFGRHTQDKELLVPAWQLSTFQLKVTYAFTDSATAGYTTSATNAKIDVIGRSLYSTERVNTPFLKKTETYSKTPASTGTESVNLPVGAGNGSYRRIMLGCYEAGIEDGVDITDFELKVNDSQTIVKDRWDTAQIKNANKYNAKHTKNINLELSNTDTWATYVSKIQSITAIGGEAVHVPTITAVAGDTITLGLSDLAVPTVVAVDETIRVAIKGSVVSHAVMIDLGTDNIADSLYVGGQAGISSLKVNYTVGATGGDTRVIAEQLVSF